MHIASFILATEDIDGVVKIAIFVVMAIVWGIAGLAKAAKKASEQARRRAAPGQLSPPPMPQANRQAASAQRRPAPQQRMPASRAVAGGFVPTAVDRAGALAQMAAPRVPPAPARKPSPPPAARAGAGSLAPVKSAAAASVKLVPHGASPLAIRRWLRPESLKKQFILTELLQPPKALRGPLE